MLEIHVISILQIPLQNFHVFIWSFHNILEAFVISRMVAKMSSVNIQVHTCMFHMSTVSQYIRKCYRNTQSTDIKEKERKNERLFIGTTLRHGYFLFFMPFDIGQSRISILQCLHNWLVRVSESLRFESSLSGKEEYERHLKETFRM